MMVIANPRAGHGRGERSIRRLRDAIRRRGYDCTVVPTEHPGHATELARRAADAGDPRVIVMGGDGTISEVVNGLIGSDTELGIIPMGTGNDVARSLGIPRGRLEAALDLAVQGETRPIDVGRERDRHFISVLGVGFPAIVAEQANAFTRLHGSAAFFVAVYKGLHRLRPVPLKIRLDDRSLATVRPGKGRRPLWLPTRWIVAQTTPPAAELHADALTPPPPPPAPLPAPPRTRQARAARSACRSPSPIRGCPEAPRRCRPRFAHRASRSPRYDSGPTEASRTPRWWRRSPSSRTLLAKYLAT